MIAGVEGILKSRDDDWVVIAVGGISLRLKSPTSTLNILGNIGDRVQLHTHLQVKEDNMTLYGFATAEEAGLFELLIGVSGIGPKTSLALLSALSPEQLRQAIAAGNVALLSSVSGVGKKTAARLVLELEAKLKRAGTATPFLHEDVVAALNSLGYSVAEATRAVAALPDFPNLPLEDKIRLALQHLGGS